MLQGKRTYIMAALMIVHGGVSVAMEVLKGQFPDQLSLMEVFNGLGLIFLRKAVS